MYENRECDGTKTRRKVERASWTPRRTLTRLVQFLFSGSALTFLIFLAFQCFSLESKWCSEIRRGSCKIPLRLNPRDGVPPSLWLTCNETLMTSDWNWMPSISLISNLDVSFLLSLSLLLSILASPICVSIFFSSTWLLVKPRCGE